MTGPAAGAPYPDDELPPRTPIDSARPWLEAGRSWAARAEQLEAYVDRRRGRPRRRWESRDPEVTALEARATACAAHALDLDRFTADGWVVWHDRVVAGTRNVVDHVLVGPAGVLLVQTIPGLDHTVADGKRTPGPRTEASVTATWSLLNTVIGPAITAAVTQVLPSWNTPINWCQVLLDTKVTDRVAGAYRPNQVPQLVAQQSAVFGPIHVQDLAAQLEDITPPAPLAG
jgi:hypothetical protein